MPRETPKPSRQLRKRGGEYVRIGKRIWWRREQHNLQSFFLSVIACFLCMHHAVEWNHFLLRCMFGNEIGTQLTVILIPVWGVIIWLKVPAVFLLEPVSDY